MTTKAAVHDRAPEVMQETVDVRGARVLVAGAIHVVDGGAALAGPGVDVR